MSDSTWLLLDRIGIILGILLGLITACGSGYSAVLWWKHQRREGELQEPILIRLTVDDGRSYELKHRPARRIVTRAEVLGLLGMIPSRQLRFDWKWLHEPQFMQHIEEVHGGLRNVLEIPVSAEEYAQLDVPAQS